MTHLDLFTGLGAFSLGFEQEGFKTACQVEIDRNCLKLLEDKWPNVRRHNDVKTFDPDSIDCLSVVTFGSPCQDLSVAGQRAGLDGERSGLFYHATRIIRKLVPRGLEFALWENVEGALSSAGGGDFGRVLAELADCGALDCCWRVLDCQYFGLAQRRRRVFLVADFREQRAAEILSISEGLQGHPAPRREAGKDIAPSLEGRAGRSGATNFHTSGGLVVRPCARSLRAQGNSTHREDGDNYIVANRIGHHHRRDDLDNDTYVLASGQANAEIVSDGSPSLTCLHEAPILARSLNAERDGYNDGSDQTYVLQAVNKVRCNKQNGIGISNGGEPCYTLTGGEQHAIAFTQNQRQEVRKLNVAGALPSIRRGDAKNETILEYKSTVRRLTPMECERLMGLPDGWTSGFSDSVRYRMIGNSVAVPVVRWIAKAMRKALA